MEETNDKKYCVYMHISPSNKRYIGITSISPPEDRWKNGHGYRHNEYFSRAIDKYGWENFQHQIIANDLTEDEAIEMEISLISEYNTTDINYGYNLTSGGEVGKIYSKEAREKMSKNHADVSGENNPRYGIRVSQETRDKISQSLIGKLSGDKHPLYGKGHTDESKQKMSQSMKERMSIPENVPFYGRHHTEETKKLFSDQRKENWKDEEYRKKHSGENAPNYGKTRGKSWMAKKVIRLADGKIYECVRDGADDNDIKYGTFLYKCHKGYGFMFYNEWFAQQNDSNEIEPIENLEEDEI